MMCSPDLHVPFSFQFFHKISVCEGKNKSQIFHEDDASDLTLPRPFSPTGAPVYGEPAGEQGAPVQPADVRWRHRRALERHRARAAAAVRTSPAGTRGKINISLLSERPAPRGGESADSMQTKFPLLVQRENKRGRRCLRL